MPFLLRRTSSPSLAEIASVPQIVVIDKTGPAISLGTSLGAACCVGEFLKGPFVPTEVNSGGQAQSLFGSISASLSQSAAALQDGSGAAFNGNGMLSLKNRSFKRLVIQRVDNDAVTADAGTTKSKVTLTVTVGAADTTAGATNKDLLIPGGTRLADQVLATATMIVMTSQDVIIPKGTTIGGGTVTTTVEAFFVRCVHPVVATAIGAIDTVIDAAIPGADAGTTITTVTNAAAMWPPGTGTTLALRIESQYSAAILKTLPTGDPQSAINVIYAARRSQVIRKALVKNAQDASEQGRGRMACVAADPATAVTSIAAAAAVTAAIALSATDSIAVDVATIAFPHGKIFSEELGSVKVTVAADSAMASTLSMFPEETNPGARNQYIQDLLELEDAFLAFPLTKTDYINLQAGGVCALQKDRQVGWWWMNGVTAVNPTVDPTRVPIKRRRMAFLIQDTIAQLAAPYLKQPATTERVDAFVSEVESFLATLKSEQNPSLQRINDFLVDGKSRNTPDLEALGIYTVLIMVRLLASMDDIVIESVIGETVTVPAAA